MIMNNEALALLHHVIKDTCAEYCSVSSIEEADTVITLEELHNFLLELLRNKINEKEKYTITLNLLRSELNNNQFFSTLSDAKEVWFIKRK
jgi:hypothetical protein